MSSIITITREALLVSVVKPETIAVRQRSLLVRILGDAGDVLSNLALELTDTVGTVFQLRLTINLDLQVFDTSGTLHSIPTDGVNLVVEDTAGTPSNIPFVSV